MKFSLIISTKDRKDELGRLLDSLATQTLQDFEIIVSDQNEDNRLDDLLRQHSFTSRLSHIRSSGGLSKARNDGLSRATGEIVAFPDDDCTYAPDLLAKVAVFFDTHPQYAYLTGNSHDESGKPLPHFCQDSGPIDRHHIYRQVVEFVFFIRRQNLGSLRFDENMGVGCSTPWQADEGPDLMLRLEDSGAHGYYDSSISAWHPQKVADYHGKAIDRSYRYACGSGYFLRKHHYSFAFFAQLQFRTACGVLLGLLKLKPGMARFYAARWRGRWRGWFGFQPKKHTL